MNKVLEMNVTEKETVTQSSQTGELLNTTDKETCLVEGSTTVDKVPGTPFTVIGQEGNFFVMCGKYRVSGIFDNKEKAEEDAKSINWDRIMQVLIVFKENNNG